MTIFTLTLTLFLIINPLGNAKQFLAFLTGISPARSRTIVIRELLIALVTILFFSFVGEWIFCLLGISKTTVYLSTGIILFLTAIKILFSTHDYIPRIAGEEPYVVPLAIPMIASPSLLAAVMLYASAEPYVSPMIVSIILAWLLSGIVLLSSRKLLNLVGNSGLLAFERLMGMVLVLIAIQRFMEGVLLFVIAHQ